MDTRPDVARHALLYALALDRLGRRFEAKSPYKTP